MSFNYQKSDFSKSSRSKGEKIPHLATAAARACGGGAVAAAVAAVAARLNKLRPTTKQQLNQHGTKMEPMWKQHGATRNPWL